jgi:hypothetical protein
MIFLVKNNVRFCRPYGTLLVFPYFYPGLTPGYELSPLRSSIQLSL